SSSNGSPRFAVSTVIVQCPKLFISKVADAPNVSAGSNVGFTVQLNNAGAGQGDGVSVTDNLPAGTGVNWSIDLANTSFGDWDISGTPPNQSLDYVGGSIRSGGVTRAHVVSGTTNASCGTYNNTATYNSSNGGTGSFSASEIVTCPTPTPTPTPTTTPNPT